MLNTEQVLTFTEASKVLPPIGGKRTHPSTLWRWARKGVRGVKLETRRLGGRFVTSIEALDRFSKDLAEVDADDASPGLPREDTTRTSKQREQSIEEAERVLDKAGIGREV